MSSLIAFLKSGEVAFYYGIPIAISMIIGGQVGAKLALTRGSKFIKPVFVVVSLMLVMKMIFDMIERE
ncbi:MAG: hypothetical protein R6U59_05505 [Eubacteriales bacterium]